MKKKIVLFSALLFLLYFLPYFLKGTGSYILTHDNLNQLNMQGIFDGKFSAPLFPFTISEDFTLPTTHAIFHLGHLKLDKLFFSLGYFNGFIFNEFFYRLLGFIGFFFLIGFIHKKLHPLLKILMAFCYIALPFWSQGNLSIAGLPLLLLAFIYLKKRKNS